ncbi:hypothetical protein FRC19_008773 [Serendipita sp. 401]|nr:hypothetical protein FRC19_008773 [Serendipita sp. 401]KAG8843827.1 hypothetical protein FRC20_003725 [Serendipita sp. 405]
MRMLRISPDWFYLVRSLESRRSSAFILTMQWSAPASNTFDGLGFQPSIIVCGLIPPGKHSFLRGKSLRESWKSPLALGLIWNAGQSGSAAVINFYEGMNQ